MNQFALNKPANADGDPAAEKRTGFKNSWSLHYGVLNGMELRQAKPYQTTHFKGVDLESESQ